MRLKILDRGHRPLQKVFLTLIRSMAGGEVPGPVATLSYRPELFGKGVTECLEEAMRKATQWSKGEVELFAAFVSRLNQCAY